MTTPELIRQFTGLYSGGLAQSKRDAGDATAMPPWAETYWLGKQVVKCPTDLWTYQEIIWETKPDLIIETGTAGGGSAFYFATLLDLIGNGRVVTVDKDSYPELRAKHFRITYLTGDSTGTEVRERMIMVAGGYKRVMISLDSLHTYEHVKRELEIYAPLVSPGCYLVVEDTGWGQTEDWADRAVAEFIAAHPEFEVDQSRERHLLTSNRGGWLRRKA